MCNRERAHKLKYVTETQYFKIIPSVVNLLIQVFDFKIPRFDNAMLINHNIAFLAYNTFTLLTPNSAPGCKEIKLYSLQKPLLALICHY